MTTRRSIVFMENLPADFPPPQASKKQARAAPAITNETIASRKRRNLSIDDGSITNEDIAKRRRRDSTEFAANAGGAISNEDIARRQRRYRAPAPRDCDVEAAITNEEIAERRRYKRKERPSGSADSSLKTRKDVYDAINKLAQEELVRVAASPTAKMTWTFAPDGAQRIAHRYGVTLHGWPAHVPFQSPSAVGSTDELRRILSRLEHGKMWFERLGDAERARLEPAPEPKRGGRKKTKGPPPKTSEIVEDSDDS
ncbi:hypothetical protein PsYK624_000660 [Phanerochaete sordida]|uniref:Uncharacterized protein n=1 Tax=Phanerochaete sordida TaxID=48140 RepID=A0A9P3FVR9_9APHY|nr:hypothetical protein PsYK624_000660 [Phanerochaete sordida]